MRSLSLESIPANKNMKLLSLLVTLLALSYANSDMTVRTFSELLNGLQRLERLNLQFNAFSKSVDVQTPQDINNACECKDLFAKHLYDFLNSLKSVVPKITWKINKSKFSNVLDNLEYFDLEVKANDNCNFQTHNLARLTSGHFKMVIQDNIEFIQNWNSHCKPNDAHHKSN